MSDITIITPTKARPEAILLCQDYVGKQTYQNFTHLIQEGGSLSENLLAAIPLVKTKYVAIFEDDDHYKPGWLAWCVEQLQTHDVVGEPLTRYYHLPTAGYDEMHTGERRASLCCTAFRRELLPLLEGAARSGSRSIDGRFWGSVRQKRIKMNAGELYVTGMKGLPGTPGIGIGHNGERYRQRDENRTVLRKWVGEQDANRYLSLLKDWSNKE